MSGTSLAAPNRAEFKRLKDCANLADAFASPEFMDRIKQSAPTHVKPARMLRTFIQATNRTPDLLKCSMRSVLGAMLTCSEVGLEPNTPLQHAFLIPFARYKWNAQKRERELVGHEVQLIFGYPGLLDLSYRSGQVTSVHADVAYKDEYDVGKFSYEYGTNSHLKHIPIGRERDGEAPVFAYAHASLRAGQAFGVMPWADVLKIRNGSQGFRAALAAKERAEKANWSSLPATWTDAPWVKYQNAMAAKTAFRALAKWLPKSVELAGVLALDESQDTGTIDFGAVLDGNASIEGGGFQEGEPLVDADPVDAGAAFTLRGEPQADPGQTPPPTQAPTATQAPAATEKPKRQTRKQENLPSANDEPDPRFRDEQPPDATTAPRQTPAPTQAPESNETAGMRSAGAVLQQPPPFTAWLVNGDGEPIDGLDGPAERYTDPVAYVSAYLDARNAEFPGTRDLLERANADDVAKACVASPEANGMMLDQSEPAAEEVVPPQPTPSQSPAQQQRQTSRWAINLPHAETKAEWEKFIDRLKLTLESATTGDQIATIIDLNSDVWDAFPGRFRLAAKALIEARQKAMVPTATKPSSPTNTVPTHQETADRLLQDIAACQSVPDMEMLEKNVAIIRMFKGLMTGAPDLYDKVKQAANARVREIQKPLRDAGSTP